MKTSNLGQYLTTVSPCIWWLSDKIEKRSRRKHLAEDGLIVAVCCMSKDSGELLQDPDLINRGSILTDSQVAEAKKIMDAADTSVLSSSNVAMAA